MNLENLTLLAYYFRDTKSFALLIKRHQLSWTLTLETSKSFALLI